MIRAEKASGSRREGRTELHVPLDFVLPVDTGTAAGKAFLDRLGVFAEFEANLRPERQLEGIKAAKALGIYKGRKPTIDPVELQRLRDEEKPGPAAIARRLGIGRASAYRVLGTHKQSA